LPVLNTFYAEYRSQLTEHIKFEETHLLPYIEILLRVESREIPYTELLNNGEFSLKGFTENHHDTEDDLSRIRDIIKQYQPPSTNQTPYRILISQLQAFEKDLSVHALIEDQILVPKALEMERNALAELKRRAKGN
jgi:regulator of cell morphogenesis and NO signaling